VFVVHGRDHNLRKSLFDFLRAIGLNPIEWRTALQLTKKPSPFVAEILDAAFANAAAIVVLLSPDDEAKLKDCFLSAGDSEYERILTGQARPNVLFEAGMAIGRRQERTVFVQVGKMRPFSDIAGVHIVHLDNSAEKRLELITKLRNAGCAVEDGGSDYLSTGNFDIPRSSDETPRYQYLSTIHEYELCDPKGRCTKIRTAEKVDILETVVGKGGSYWTSRPYDLRTFYKYIDRDSDPPFENLSEVEVGKVFKTAGNLYGWDTYYEPELKGGRRAWLVTTLEVHDEYSSSTCHDCFHAQVSIEEFTWRIIFPTERPAKRWWGTVGYSARGPSEQGLAQHDRSTSRIEWQVKNLLRGQIYFINWKW